MQNQRAIEAESKALQAEAVRFARQTTSWLHMLDDFNSSLHALGDVEHWADTVEKELEYVSSAMEFVASASASKE